MTHTTTSDYRFAFGSPGKKTKGFNLPADPCTEEIEIEIEAAEFLLEAGTHPCRSTSLVTVHTQAQQGSTFPWT